MLLRYVIDQFCSHTLLFSTSPPTTTLDDAASLLRPSLLSIHSHYPLPGTSYHSYTQQHGCTTTTTNYAMTTAGLNDGYRRLGHRFLFFLLSLILIN
jgi:hypothetical protein